MGLSPAPSADGRLIDGKYRLSDVIGGGAMGVVYRAEHVHLRRAVAVKLLTAAAPDSEAVLRFRREAEALGRLRHPHVVEVSDFGVDPEERRPYLVMELLEGTPLDALGVAARLDPNRALRLLDGIASALDHAHAHGVLHRDLKPANVIVAPGDGQAVKVLDFGLARLVEEVPHSPVREVVPSQDPVLTASGAMIGTPLYAAPETIESGAASVASDVYSFGVMAYELLVGRPPFQGTTAEVLAGHRRSPPPDPAALGASVPAGASRALQDALSKDPALRPPSAADLVRRLRNAYDEAAAAALRARLRAPRLAWCAGLLAATPLVSALLASLPPARALELWSLDRRLALRGSRPPDPRIVLLWVDAASLAASPDPMGDRADEFGRGLAEIMRSGASGVAIDFILPEKWSRSVAFSDLVLAHRERLTLAAMGGSDGRTMGTDSVAGLTTAALGEADAAALFGLVNIREDQDGRVRRARLAFPSVTGSPLPSWAARAARTLAGPSVVPEDTEDFLIDHAIDWRAFQSLAWRDLPGVLAREPVRFRGRLVLLGGELSYGDDSHRVPGIGRASENVSGLVLQALIVQTILENRPIRPAPPIAAVAGLAMGWGALLSVLLLSRPWSALAFLVSLALAWLVASALLITTSGTVLPISGPLLTGTAGLLLGWMARLRLGAWTASTKGP